MNNVMENLNKKGSVYKFNAIVACTQLKAVPDEVIEKVKDVATKENLEKVKDKAEDLFDKIKK